MSKDDRELIEGEALARRFHETYERLAPWFGYKTRADTKAFDPTTPNGRLMIAACSELAATRLEALQAQPVGERDREYWARVLHDAWPHTVISQALSEVTGLPIGTVLSWDAVKEAGADCSGLYRFADAVVAALTASPPVVEREAIANALHMEARRLSRAVDGSDDCPETYDQDALNWVRNRRYQLADAILALTPVSASPDTPKRPGFQDA